MALNEQNSNLKTQTSRIDKSRFEQILEVLPDFLYIVDLDFNITYINRVERCDPVDSLIGRPIFTQTSTPEEAEQLRQLLEHIKQTKEPTHFQGSQAFGEETRHFYSSVTPRLSEEGELIEFLFMTRDITSVVDTQSSLASSEANFNSLFNNSTFAFVEISAPLIKDIIAELRAIEPGHLDQYLQDNIRLTAKALGSANIIRANQRFFELFEIESKEQLTELLFTYNYLPVAQGPVNAFFKALLEGQKTLETRFPLHFWVKPQKTIVASVNLEQILETERVLIGYLDITPLEKVQSQLQINHERLRTVMETAPIGMMEVHMGTLMHFFQHQDPSFFKHLAQLETLSLDQIPFLLDNIEIAYINSYGLQMLGVESLNELKKSLSKLFTQGTINSFKEFLDGLLQGKREFRVNYPFQNRKGEAKEAEFYFALPDAGNLDQANLVQFVDVTDYRNIQNELMQNVMELRKANKLLDEFVNTAAHDLRTPLADLVGLAQIYEQDYPELSSNPIFTMMKSSIQQLIRTVDGLVEVLDIQKDEKHLAKPIKILDCIYTSMGLYETEIKQRGAIINCDLQVEEILYINGYLQSILNNLLSNALKYSAQGRSLNISISTQATKDDAVLLIFEDNGVGIAPDDLSKLFKPFTRLHVKETSGTGMGLYLTKTMVEKNGGHIQVESSPNQFTRFTLQLNPYV